MIALFGQVVAFQPSEPRVGNPRRIAYEQNRFRHLPKFRFPVLGEKIRRLHLCRNRDTPARESVFQYIDVLLVNVGSVTPFRSAKHPKGLDEKSARATSRLDDAVRGNAVFLQQNADFPGKLSGRLEIAVFHFFRILGHRFRLGRPRMPPTLRSFLIERPCRNPSARIVLLSDILPFSAPWLSACPQRE